MTNGSILVHIDDMISGLRELRERLQEEGLTENDLLNQVAEELQLDVAAITSSSRKRDLVEARVIYAVLRKKQSITHVQIADELNRQHTSIVCYLRNHRDWKLTDRTYYRKYHRVKDAICKK
jgi:chromosomal replication initiation ATPase DnaA